MVRPTRLSLAVFGIASISLASLPTAEANPVEKAQGDAKDLGAMSISLKDVVKPQIGLQGALQGAGTPNQAGLGGFVPLAIGANSVFFADVLANANFRDYSDSSSIVNTTVAGTTISTSSRLGYRWLNGDRSWMYGINAGYDTRPMSTGPADTGVTVTASRTAFFQQAAVNAQAISDAWEFNAYGLIPTGRTEQQLNNVYAGGALDTIGLDASYNINEWLKASTGYYYQNGDRNAADGSGVSTRLAYEVSPGVEVAANYSYDDAFKSRFSADIKWRFNIQKATSSESDQSQAIRSLSSTPGYRTVRVHDRLHWSWNRCEDALIDGIPYDIAIEALGEAMEVGMLPGLAFDGAECIAGGLGVL